jgi:branched-chain amino acid transport system substrate-binding protein
MSRQSAWRRSSGRAVAILTTFALVVAACGDDDDDPEADETTAEVTATEEPTATEPAATEPTATEPADTEPTATEPAATDAPTAEETTAATGEASGTLKLGILGECEGAFGGFHEDVVAGATLAMVEDGGATPNSTTTALDGFTGANVGGLDIELVGIGCGDDTADRIIQEVRTLVEQDGAEVVIGPLSGDESIAVANYAKDHPEVTFIDGIAGAQDTTLKVQAPNYFRFHGDGAQWNAGLGDRLHTEAGWDTVAVIADDYSFGWTSAAGFIADFCAVGGDVVTRVFPPLGTTDYSSFVQQLPDPDEVDGYFWVVGGTGTNAALEAFVNAKGDLDGSQHAGNLFFSPALASALGPNIAGAYVGGFASLPGDVKTPEIEAYLASADATWDTLAAGAAGGAVGPPSVAMGFGFAYGYYVAGKALNQALEAVGGDLSDNHAALREEMSTMTLDVPYGSVKLDENRHGIITTYVQQLVLDENDEVVSQTVALIPDVDQSFGGTFTPETPSPDRENPPCEERELPWSGNAIPVVDGVPQE